MTAALDWIPSPRPERFMPAQPLDVDALRARLDFLPECMRAARRWLLWTADKAPHYTDGTRRHGKLDAPDDVARLGTLDGALEALERWPSRFAGVGFALGFDAVLSAHWQGLDLDDAMHDGMPRQGRARELFHATEGYAETSPSGRGLHVIGLGPRFQSIAWVKNLPPGGQKVEAYAGGRFFTVTGRMLREGEPVDLSPLVEQIRDELAATSGRRVDRVRAVVGEAGAYLERQGPELRAWLRAHPVEQALADAGYLERGGRWLSPLSESGIPGVTVLDELRAVSFHASDAGLGTRGDGDCEVFNAFDLAARFQFAGNRARAMAKLLPAARPYALASDPAASRPWDESSAPPAGAPEPQEARFRLLTADDLAALPPVLWRVRGVLPAEGLAAIFGPPGSGKSFLALDMLGAIAEGRDWFAHRTVAAPVVYVALEGEAGIAQRVNAYRLRYGRAPARMRFVAQPLALLAPDDVDALASAVHAAGAAGGVVAIDTLNRASPGADENDSRDMGAIIDGAKRLQAALGGLVLLVHHSGKDQTRGLRGHSSLLAALDAVVEVTRNGDVRDWRIAKAKDGADGDAHPFRLDVVELGADDDMEPVTSCVVEMAERAHRPMKPLGGNQKVAWEVLGELLRGVGDAPPAGAPNELPPGRPAVTLDAAADAIGPHLVCEPKRRRERAIASIRGFCARGRLVHVAGWLWCA